MTARTGAFRDAEVEIAREVIEAAVTNGEYRALAAAIDGVTAGYAVWGAAPLTEGTWDLYWLVVDPAAWGSACGEALVRAALADVAESGGRLLLVETESTAPYARARRFYDKHGFETIAVVPDFYRVGADKLILRHRVGRESRRDGE